MKNLSLGIVGTAKNTGKTTTTMALLNCFCERGLQVGLTSIGYDGERLDNITGLPKPRLFVKKGVVVATADKCINNSTAKIKILDRLDITTPLGKVVCGRVEQEGLLVLAGPNRSTQLRKIKNYLSRQGVELVMVDGALNRISPMVETDGFILATGASFNQDTFKIAVHAHYLNRVCNFPKYSKLSRRVINSGKTMIWNEKTQEILAETNASLFEPKQLSPLADLAPAATTFYCPGIIMSLCLKELLQMSFPENITYIFSDPSKLIIGNELVKANEFINTAVKRGGKVCYRQTLPLMAVTINPFYPKYRYKTREYQPAYVNKERLLNKVSELVDVPVYDMASDSCDKLAAALEFKLLQK